MASYFAKMSFFKNQQKDAGCQKKEKYDLTRVIVQYTFYKKMTNFGQFLALCEQNS